VNNIQEVKSFGRGDYETQRFSKRQATYHLFEYDWIIADIFKNVSLTTFRVVFEGLVLLYSSYQLVNNEITIGTLMALTQYIKMLFNPLESMSNIYTEFEKDCKKKS